MRGAGDTTRRWRTMLAAALALVGVGAVLTACVAPGVTVQRAERDATDRVTSLTIEGGSGSAGGGAAATGEGVWGEAWRDPRSAVWPRRFGRGRPGSMGLIEEMTGPVVAMRQGDEQRREVKPEMLEDIAKLMAQRGRGWFRLAPTITVKGEGAGAFVFTTDRVADPKRVKTPTEPALYLKFISGTRDDTGEVVRMQRTWFAYYEPVGFGPHDQVRRGGADDAGACRGLAVVIPGIFGTPSSQVSQTVHALRARGWAVLRMLAHPSRFTENAAFVLGGTGAGGAPAEDVERLARLIADTLGDRAAECAYAVEEAAEWLVQRRSMLAGKPRVAVGMSGGAMVMPTVVARNPGAYAGAVLIAGGADYLSVAIESNYAEWIDALRFRRSGDRGGGGTIDEATRAGLVAAYRRAAPLDSLFTAAALRGMPVLMLHARQDRAVPAHLGDELWESAGRPERWIFDAGHEFLFFWLPRHLDRVADWIDQHLASGGGPRARAGERAEAMSCWRS